MAALAERLTRANVRPAEWDALMPDDGGRVPWQVWMRRKGAGYWLMRWATRLARRLGADVSNPNGIEEAGTFWTEAEAQDLCRIIHQVTGGRYAVTYDPVIVGRAYPLKSLIAPRDERLKPFDPFKTFDFSATDAVNEQARHVLVSVDELEKIAS